MTDGRSNGLYKHTGDIVESNGKSTVSCSRLNIALLSFCSLTVNECHRWPVFHTVSDTFHHEKTSRCSQKAVNLVAPILLRSIHDLWLSRGQGDSTRMSISKLLDLHGTHTAFESLSPVTFQPDKLQSALKCGESQFWSFHLTTIRAKLQPALLIWFLQNAKQ